MDPIILIIGGLDALVVAGLGLVAAGLKISGVDSDLFYERVMPASAIVAVTGTVAGAILLATKFFAGA